MKFVFFLTPKNANQVLVNAGEEDKEDGEGILLVRVCNHGADVGIENRV